MVLDFMLLILQMVARRCSGKIAILHYPFPSFFLQGTCLNDKSGPPSLALVLDPGWRAKYI